jgi:sugar/nucleoside kinase (ribokinase family)
VTIKQNPATLRVQEAQREVENRWWHNWPQRLPTVLYAAAADHIHLGGAELLGPDTATRILQHVKENGVTTSVDLIAPGGMETFDIIAPVMAYTDYLLPNEEQVLGFTGAADLAEGSRRLLEAGAGLLAITCGADAALISSATKGLNRFRRLPSM